MPIHIQHVESPDDAQCEAVNAILRTHNRRANPDFWAAREMPENEPVPIHLFAYDDGGTIVGGLFGTTQFAWLKVDIMAVAEAARGAGIGRALLQRAEDLARERGCTKAYVDTMDYQAPGFYQKLGYRVTGTLEDWDSLGHAKFFLVKSLGAS